jgi:hypothetical protein
MKTLHHFIENIICFIFGRSSWSAFAKKNKKIYYPSFFDGHPQPHGHLFIQIYFLNLKL